MEDKGETERSGFELSTLVSQISSTFMFYSRILHKISFEKSILFFKKMSTLFKGE